MIVTDLSGSFNPVPKIKIEQKKKIKAVKGKKHKQTKEKEILKKVKETVWNRDNNRCICCGIYVPKSCANAHFIKRSQRRFRHKGKHSHIML